MSGKSGDELRDGVSLTNLDQPLFDEADATKRDLVEYLDAVRDRILPGLEDRPLSVIRVHRGQDAFMQKNVPKYTPSWVRTVRFWAATSRRDVFYALCSITRPWCGPIVLTDQRILCSTSTHPTPTPSRWPSGRPTWYAARWPMSGWKVRSRPAGRRVCTSSYRSTTRHRPRTRPPRLERLRRGPRVSIPTSPQPRS